MRGVDPYHGKQQRRKRLREDRILADRHRTDGVAMVPVMEGDEGPAVRLIEVAPVLTRQLERHLYGGRAVIGVEHVRQTRRQRLDEALRQVDGRNVRAAGKHHVLELSRLLDERFI